MKLRKLAAVPILTLLMLPFLALPVSAETVGYTNNLRDIGTELGVSEAKTLPVIIGGLIKQALALLGIILLVIIIYGGFLWMTAGGNSEQVDKAKKWITNAVIGLIIIVAAYAITAFVFDAILRGTGTI